MSEPTKSTGPAPRTPDRRRARALRWAVPVLVAGVVVTVASGALHASADVNLPPRTAAELLADIQTTETPAFDGTIIEKASLGLPDLPSTGAAGSDTSMLGLLTGSHTVKIWYGDRERQRLALLGTVGETDVFHSGSQLWQWDSNSRTATHVTLPADASGQSPSPQVTGTLTPQQLAQQALARLDPTTKVDVDQAVEVAGRKAYELVLQPRDTTSRVGSVRIAVDGDTKLPLRVQVYGRGDGSGPAFDVSFTSVTYAEPDASMFDFTPPSGATVTQTSVGEPGATPGAATGAGRTAMAEPQVLGSGWTSVAFSRLPADATGSTTSGRDESLPAMLGALPQVSGAWGSGRLLDSTLVSALLTDDGRLFVGAVDPSVLYLAATAHR